MFKTINNKFLKYVFSVKFFRKKFWNNMQKELLDNYQKNLEKKIERVIKTLDSKPDRHLGFLHLKN